MATDTWCVLDNCTLPLMPSPVDHFTYSVPFLAFSAILVIGFPFLLAGPMLILNSVFIVFPKMLLHFCGLRHCKDMPKRLPHSVWIIHGKLYDLESWAKHHPGGRYAIDLGRNRDCTGLFESYHIFMDRNVLEKMLERYEVKDERSQQLSQMIADLNTGAGSLTKDDFSCPFFEDVKIFAREHFKGKSHKMKPAVVCGVALLFMLEVLTAYWSLRGSNLALWTLPALNWLATCSVAHDASHFAVSSIPWVNRIASYAGFPLFFGPTSWNIQHVVQHHVYTNTENDVDLYHFLPVVRTSRLTKFIGMFRYQAHVIFLVIPTAVAHLLFVVPLDLLAGTIDAVTGTQRYQQCQNLGDFVVRKRFDLTLDLFIPLLWAVLNLYAHGFLLGFGRLMASWTCASYLFIVFTQGAHMHASCHDVGDETSWAKRQVMTAVSFKAESYLWLFLSGGLNMQGLHHLLPGIGSYHLIDMWPEFRKVCRKHGVDLKESPNVREFFGGFLNWIGDLSHEELKVVQ